MSEHDVAPFLREYLAREGLIFRDEEGWEELADHVKVHKYFMDRKDGKETDWRDALDSWFRTVYKPLRAACDSEEVHEAFPNKKTGELYMGISHHWLFMKQYQPETTPAEAAHDFAIRYGEGLRRWFRRVEDTGIS